MNEPRMAALLVSSGRPGFYFRVLREGEVGEGGEIVKVGEAAERMTVAEIDALLYLPNHARDRLERALRIERFRPDGVARLKRCSRVSKTGRQRETRDWRLPRRPIRRRWDFSRSS